MKRLPHEKGLRSTSTEKGTRTGAWGSLLRAIGVGKGSIKFDQQNYIAKALEGFVSQRSLSQAPF